MSAEISVWSGGVWSRRTQEWRQSPRELREVSGEQAGIWIFGQGSARNRSQGFSSEDRKGSAAVGGERGGVEQVRKGPAAGQVHAHTASSLADASTEFEQLGPQGFNLRRAPGLR